MTATEPSVHGMDLKIVSGIRADIDAIERSERVAIPLAVESGSRAWGFPSPDSDYDCRFVFIRSVEQTYTLFPRRDVIERPIIDMIDLNGWELSKSLRLLLKGNAVIIEWLTSPFAYRADEAFRSAFLDLAEQVADRRLVANHYYYLADSQIRRFFADPDNVALKKLLYALRPLIALRWLERHPRCAVAPMHFPTLLKHAELTADCAAATHDLLEAKARTNELGEGPIPAALRHFIEAEHARAGDLWRDPGPADRHADRLTLADRFWCEWVERLAPPTTA